jgi:hypothetical protein
MARRTILPVLLLIIAIILFYILYPFDSNQDMKENFIVTAIRAKDCRCLPGYIPSNLKKGKITPFYFCQKITKLDKTMKCY